MKLSEYIGTLETGEIGEYFADYDSGYICDVITEIADNQIGIYYQEQIDFAMENPEWVSEAFFQGIAPDAEYHFRKEGGDFYTYCAKVGVAAWYEKNVSDLYKNMDENVRLSIFTALRRYGIEDLSDDQITEIEMLSFDNNDRLEDIIERALEIFAEEEEGEDE
jgi:hypothetical protein